MEYLDIVDENAMPTGKIASRKEVHQKGLRYHSTHVWIFRYQNDNVQILLQKRSKNKDSFPNCYDISCAGHIPAGEHYLDSALRELKEELGLDTKKEELYDCGLYLSYVDTMFYGERFIANQVSHLLYLFCDKEVFTLQEEEVSEVKWMDFNDCLEAVKNNRIVHCIEYEELLELKERGHFQ